MARFLALPMLVLALAIAGCVATPLPDPPSLTTSLMSLSESQPDRVMLDGADGAVHDFGIQMRVTNPRTAAAGGRVVVVVSGAGAFASELAGSIDDVLYLETVSPMGGDVLLGAVRSGGGGTVVPADPGADRDGDSSPDAIDCAPLDPMLASRECACSADSECAVGEVCRAGVCSAPACATDVDCGMGRMCLRGTCVPGGGCLVDGDCVAGQYCLSSVCTACMATEVCGNGLDDDCNGIADDIPPCR